MPRRLLASVLLAALVVSGCAKSASPRNSVSQPTDEINPATGDDTTAEDMAAKCNAGFPVLGRPLRIVTTIAPITSLVGQLVSGTSIEVRGLVPETANSHTYVFTSADRAAIARADIVFSNGLRMENGLEELAKSSMQKDATYCEIATAAIQKSDYAYDATFTQDNETPNPHVWMNPSMLLRYINIIRDAITQRSKEGMDVIDTHYVRLSQQTNALDAAMATSIGTVPVRNRTLYMFHDSLAYFASHFKFDVGLVFQNSSFGPPSPVEVADAIAAVKSEKAPGFIGQNEFPGTFYGEIAKAAGIKVAMISDEHLPGGAGSAGHSVLSMMKNDFVSIVEVLGGNPAAVKTVDVTKGVKDKATYAN